jgi:hypothetical protein
MFATVESSGDLDGFADRQFGFSYDNLSRRTGLTRPSGVDLPPFSARLILQLNQQQPELWEMYGPPLDCKQNLCRGGLVCSNVSGLFVEPSSWP